MSLLHTTVRYADWVSLLSSALFTYSPAPHKARLDPRQLSDHLKRDMGFLDGNGSKGRHN